MNETVKILRDNDRIAIIIEGAEDERIEGMYRVLDAFYHFDPAPATPVEDGTSKQPTQARAPLAGMAQVKGLQSAPSDAEPMPTQEQLDKMPLYTGIGQYPHPKLSAGPYQGMTATDALNKDRERALFTLFCYVRRIRQMTPERADIIQSCRSFMYDLPNLASLYDTREKQIDCLTTLSKMGGIDSHINGWPSFTVFAQSASDDEVNIVFDQVMYSFRARALHLNS